MFIYICDHGNYGNALYLSLHLHFIILHIHCLVLASCLSVGNCFPPPSLPAGVELFPFTATTERSVIFTTCVQGYQPQTEIQSTCIGDGTSWEWLPSPASHCTGE